MLTIDLNRTDGGECVCTAVGDLDASTAWRLRQVMAELASTSLVLLDMSGVTFVDSAGLGALVGGIRRTREFGGDVAVVCNRPVINRLLHTTGLDRIVVIVETMKEALQELQTNITDSSVDAWAVASLRSR
jgi:anti-sigma B factor antagonist